MNYHDKAVAPSSDDVQQKRDLVRRVLESPQLRRASKLCQLLTYLAERSLGSASGDLREEEIGCRVYGRAPGYNPSEDSIARVEIRNLRRKLEEYFQTDGASEPVAIAIPKGNYRLSFDRNTAKLPEHTRLHKRLLTPALAFSVVLGALCAAPLWLFLGARWVVTPQAPREDSRNGVKLPLWSSLFAPGKNVHIVVPDSIWAEAQYIFGRDDTLADYLKWQTSPSNLPARWRGLESEAQHIFSLQYTSMAAVQLVSKMMLLPGIDRDRVFVRFARNLQTRDFKGNNVILLGSFRGDPWVKLFEKDLNFQFEFDNQLKRPLFRNRASAPGERAVYIARGAEGASDEIYARAAFVPNLSRDGHVLVLAGTFMEGTEALGEYLMNPVLVSKVVRDLGLEKNGVVQSFELLVRSSLVGGSFAGTEVLAHRILDR